MTARVAAAGLLFSVALAGCGNRRAPDLFVLTRTGTIPGAALSLRVSDDGRVRCNGGEARQMPDERTLDAREIARELAGEAADEVSLPPGPRSILRYRVRLEDGTVAFSDTSPRQTGEMFEVQAFARRVAKDVCGLAR